MFFGIFTLITDWKAIQSHGFFQGYSSAVWAIVVLQALSGMAVSFVIKYADIVSKSFCVSVADIIAVMFALATCDTLARRRLDLQFVVGAMGVFAAVYVYNSRCGGFTIATWLFFARSSAGSRSRRALFYVLLGGANLMGICSLLKQSRDLTSTIESYPMIGQ